eukprot:757118-Hanusia_phi.AAC.1
MKREERIREERTGEDKGGEDKGGEDKGGEDQGGEDKGGEGEGGEGEGGEDKGGGDQGGEDQGGEDQGGEDQGGEDKGLPCLSGSSSSLCILRTPLILSSGIREERTREEREERIREERRRLWREEFKDARMSTLNLRCKGRKTSHLRPMKCKDPNWTEKVPLLLLPQAYQIRNFLSSSLERSYSEHANLPAEVSEDVKNPAISCLSFALSVDKSQIAVNYPSQHGRGRCLRLYFLQWSRDCLQRKASRYKTNAKALSKQLRHASEDVMRKNTARLEACVQEASTRISREARDLEKEFGDLRKEIASTVSHEEDLYSSHRDLRIKYAELQEESKCSQKQIQNLKSMNSDLWRESESYYLKQKAHIAQQDSTISQLQLEVQEMQRREAKLKKKLEKGRTMELRRLQKLALLEEVGTTLLKTCMGNEHNPVCTIVPEGPGAENSLNFRIDKLVNGSTTCQRLRSSLPAGSVGLRPARHAG